METELFYGPADGEPIEGHRQRESREKRAKRVCFSCPVMQKCLNWNLEFGPHQHGIGGGLTADERRTLRAKRMRQTWPSA
jgi:WhiB family redox-sensing transcriptional regulator